MDPWFHEVWQCSNALLGSTVSQWPLGPKGHHGVKHVSLIPGVSDEQHWPLGSMGPCNVTMAPSLHEVLLCYNALHGPTRPCSVTVTPWFHKAPEYHREFLGAAVSQWSPGYTRSCSVTRDPWFHGAPQCHNCSLSSKSPCNGTMAP